MKRLIAACALIVAATGAAKADGITVFQEGKKFSAPEVPVKRGDTITFTNKDPITHNVFSSTPKLAFDLKTQKSGESSEVKFDTAGEADVQCAIHPQMKMKVKVTE